jgi:hypothetical protein
LELVTTNALRRLELSVRVESGRVGDGGLSARNVQIPTIIATDAASLRSLGATGGVLTLDMAAMIGMSTWQPLGDESVTLVLREPLDDTERWQAMCSSLSTIP